jgi:hypothetical protein
VRDKKVSEMVRHLTLALFVVGCAGRKASVPAIDAGPELEARDGTTFEDGSTMPGCGDPVRTQHDMPMGSCGAPGLVCNYEMRAVCEDGKTIQTYNFLECTCSDGTWNCVRDGGGLSLNPCDAGGD